MDEKDKKTLKPNQPDRLVLEDNRQTQIENPDVMETRKVKPSAGAI